MAGSSGIQTTVGTLQAPAVAGDFASTNPRATVLAAQFGLVAGANGVIVARFAWATYPSDSDGSPAIVNSAGSGPVTGFVHREQQGLIVNYLADSGLTIQPGFGVTLFQAGDFWVVNSGTAEAQVGQKCYASFATGLATFAATGAPTNGATSSASSIAASTFSTTASINGNVLTVTAVGSGTLYPGSTIAGTNVATGTQIVSQLTGTAGGVGTYLLNVGEQTVVSETITGTYGTLTVGGSLTGTFAVGDVITGTNVIAGTQITALISGTGGAGTYVVNNNTVVSSTAINAQANVETKWVAMSTGLPGELVKISSWALG